jgi:hypothetical protein
MIKYINISNSKQYALPILSAKETKMFSNDEKGWCFSNIYYPLELKNVFIALKKIKYKNNKDFSTEAIKSNLPYVSTPWESRRILEHENALINFGLVSKDRIPIKNFFEENEFSDSLNKNDIELFKRIYHSYFRFKEIHSWLLDPIHEEHQFFLQQVTPENLSNNSMPIFPFMMENRFNDAFLYSLKDNTDIYRIPNDKLNKNGGLMRFWDVYIKWGIELNLLEKFNLKNLDYELSNNLKSLSCVYYINSQKPNFNLLDFIKSEYNSNLIHIPKLILKIALKYRYRINDIKNMLIEQAEAHSNLLSLQRTSEIFIRNTEINFVPKYKDSYISHILLQ